MGSGIALSGLAWVGAGCDPACASTRGTRVASRGRSCPTPLLTTGEVLVSATGLEFAYSQAPAAMKGVIMSFWYLSVTFGNLWVLIDQRGGPERRR